MGKVLSVATETGFLRGHGRRAEWVQPFEIRNKIHSRYVAAEAGLRTDRLFTYDRRGRDVPDMTRKRSSPRFCHVGVHTSVFAVQ